MGKSTASILVVAVTVLAAPGSAWANFRSVEPGVVTQVVDANIASAIRAEVIVDANGKWSSTGTELVATAPRVQVRSNIAYMFSDHVEVLGVDVDVSCRSGGAACPRTTPPTTSGTRDFTPVVSQTLDFGVPMVVDTTDWSVVVVYSFRPATL